MKTNSPADAPTPSGLRTVNIYSADGSGNRTLDLTKQTPRQLEAANTPRFRNHEDRAI